MQGRKVGTYVTLPKDLAAHPCAEVTNFSNTRRGFEYIFSFLILPFFLFANNRARCFYEINY